MQISRPFLLVPLVAILSSLIACVPSRSLRLVSKAAGCGKDTDCKGARICLAGTCGDAPRVPAIVTPPPVEPPVENVLAPTTTRAGSQFHGDAKHTGRYLGRLPATAPREVARIGTQGTVFGGVALASGLAIFGSHDRGVYAVAYGDSTAVTDRPDAGTSDGGVAAGPTIRWRRELGDLVWATPAVGEGVVYVGSDDDGLYSLEVGTGAVRWRFPVGPCKTKRKVGPEGARCDVDGIAVGADGTIYASADGLYAVRPDGTLKWKFSPGTTHCAGAPAIADDGTVYVGCQDDVLYAIGPDGQKRWDVRTGDDVDSSPAIGTDGTIYVGSDDKKLWAISPTGQVRFAVLTGGAVRSSPALGADGTVVVGSMDGQLYAIAPTGAVRFTYRAADRIASSPILDADGAILFGSEDDRLYALEPDGRLRWSVLFDGDVDGTATLGDDGTLFIGADDRALHILK